MGLLQARVSLRDRPIVPALLSIPGIALPLFYASIFAVALVNPQPPREGSVGPNFFIFLLPFLIAVAAILAIIPAIFTIFLLTQPSHHRNWGIALTVWYAVETIYLGLGVVVSLSTPNYTYGASGQNSLSWGDLQVFPPLLGLLGGVWAICWHTGASRADLRLRILGPAGRILLGGLVIFVSTGFIPYFAIFTAPAIILLFVSLLVFLVPKASQVLGGFVIVVCAFVGLTLPAQASVLFGYPIDYYYVLGAALGALIAGTILAGSGGVAALRGKTNSTRQQREDRSAM